MQVRRSEIRKYRKNKETIKGVEEKSTSTISSAYFLQKVFQI
jgi:hypothetical protein